MGIKPKIVLTSEPHKRMLAERGPDASKPDESEPPAEEAAAEQAADDAIKEEAVEYSLL